jgi:hypothetical protein
MTAGARAAAARRDLAAMQRHAAGVPSVATRVYALEAMRRLVLKTPVDTGRARGNWQVGEGAPNATVTDAVDPGGSRVAGELATAINALAGQQVVYLTNGLPYIPVLEFGGYPQREGGTLKVTPQGFSRQAPQGMIGVTVEELRTLAAQLADRIRIRVQVGGTSFPAGA